MKDEFDESSDGSVTYKNANQDMKDFVYFHKVKKKYPLHISRIYSTYKRVNDLKNI